MRVVQYIAALGVNKRIKQIKNRTDGNIKTQKKRGSAADK